MPPRGRERVVDARGDDAIDPEILGDLAELREVVAALRSLERRDEREERPPPGARVGRHAAHPRLLGEDEIHLGAGACHPDPADRLEEIGRHGVALDEAQERALGIGVREDRPRADLRAVLEHDAARAAVPHHDPRDGRRGPDLRPEPAGGGPHPADDVAVEALRAVLASGEEVEQEPDGRTRQIGPAVLAVDIVRQDQRLDRLRFVVAIEEIAEAPGQKR